MALTQDQIDSILKDDPSIVSRILAENKTKNQSSISNTPRSTVSGTWADILKPIVSNPVGEFLGGGDIQRALDSASYSQPLTYGKNLQTGGIRPEYLLGALALTPANKVKKAKTEFELAHELAQKNATLPIEQGGLGLHPQNTAMDRAKALGFDANAYHGTPYDISAVDLSHAGKGFDQHGSASLYTATNPYLASGFAPHPDIKEGGNVLPLTIRTKQFIPSDTQGKLTSNQIKSLIEKSPDEYALSNFGDINYEGKNKVMKEAINAYKDVGNGELLNQLNMINNDFYKGNEGQFLKNVIDTTGIRGMNVDVGGGEKFHLPYDPKDIRSRFAAFDPFRRNEADILAGVGVAAPTGLLMTKEDKKRNKK